MTGHPLLWNCWRTLSGIWKSESGSVLISAFSCAKTVGNARKHRRRATPNVVEKRFTAIRLRRIGTKFHDTCWYQAIPYPIPNFRPEEKRIVEYGELTTRKRAVIVARTDAPVVWPKPIPIGSRTLKDILEPSEAVVNEWFDRTSKAWMFNHWDRQTAKGNGFASQIVTAESTSVGTIKKRYLAGQGDNPVLAHPTKEGVYRMFTLAEIKRLAALRDDYYLGESKTTAGEVIGQGIIVFTMREVIALNVGLREAPSTSVAKLAATEEMLSQDQLPLFCLSA